MRFYKLCKIPDFKLKSIISPSGLLENESSTVNGKISLANGESEIKICFAKAKQRSSYKGRKENALALGADERRDKLR